ncbi:MAG: universal stress protein [Clostridia bacterium]|nr:universal stress protein [Clostridia bacterium]
MNSIMVCVTGQKSCERLIQRAIVRSRVAPSTVHVVHCIQTGKRVMNSIDEPDAIEYLFTAAQVAGADMTVLREDRVEDALVGYAKNNGITLIILGASPESGESFVSRLQHRLPDIEFDVVMQA